VRASLTGVVFFVFYYCDGQLNNFDPILKGAIGEDQLSDNLPEGLQEKSSAHSRKSLS